MVSIRAKSSVREGSARSLVEALAAELTEYLRAKRSVDWTSPDLVDTKNRRVDDSDGQRLKPQACGCSDRRRFRNSIVFRLCGLDLNSQTSPARTKLWSGEIE